MAPMHKYNRKRIGTRHFNVNSLRSTGEKKKKVIIAQTETGEKKKQRERNLIFQAPKGKKNGDQNRILSERMGS